MDAVVIRGPWTVRRSGGSDSGHAREEAGVVHEAPGRAVVRMAVGQERRRDHDLWTEASDGVDDGDPVSGRRSEMAVRERKADALTEPEYRRRLVPLLPTLVRSAVGGHLPGGQIDHRYP